MAYNIGVNNNQRIKKGQNEYSNIKEILSLSSLIWNNIPIIINTTDLNPQWNEFIEVETSNELSQSYSFTIVKSLKPKNVLIELMKLKNDRGQTPFYLACRVGNPNTVRFLYENILKDKLLDHCYLNNDRQNYLHGLYWCHDSMKSIKDVFIITDLFINSNLPLFQHFIKSKDEKGEDPLLLLENIFSLLGITNYRYNIDEYRIIRLIKYLSNLYIKNKDDFDKLLNHNLSNDINNIIFKNLKTSYKGYDEIKNLQDEMKIFKMIHIPYYQPNINIDTEKINELLINELANIITTGKIIIKDKYVNNLINKHILTTLEPNLNKKYCTYLQGISTKIKVDILIENICDVIKVINNDIALIDIELPNKIRDKLKKIYPTNPISTNLILIQNVLTLKI